MSYPNPPAPKALRRSRTDKFLGGVCGGVADYLNMDPTLVRVLTVIITLFTAVPVVAYVIAWLVMPEGEASTAPPSVYPGTPAYPPYSGAPRTDTSPAGEDVWGPAGPPWENIPAAPPAAAEGPDQRGDDSTSP